MTVLHIDEYNAKGEAYSAERGRTPDTVYPKLVTTQTPITTSGSSQRSAVVNAATAFVSIRPIGGAVHVKIGPSAVATTSDKYLADGDAWDVDVDAGDTIAVIDAA